MINFKPKKILVVFFLAMFSISVLWAAELNFPLPATTVKIREEKARFGPIKTITKTYKSALNRDQINSFYEKEMVLAGWSQQEKRVFTKNKYLVIISSYSSGSKSNENRFTMTICNIPTKEEVLASYNTKPEKLNYMPIYPGSTQSIFLKLSGSTTSSYETDDSIKEVVFFYESGMVKYGWGLVNRIPATGIADKVVLLFGRQNGETCQIQVSSVSSSLNDLFNKDKPINKINVRRAEKTGILVNYNTYGKNKP
ncbi:MAG: hypothetical protein NT014_01335 [Candidatus Omnitrophica bacterium]|nr:hypothetical protein [Candidatus Omnitrophota bacterium]